MQPLFPLYEHDQALYHDHLAHNLPPHVIDVQQDQNVLYPSLREGRLRPDGHATPDPTDSFVLA